MDDATDRARGTPPWRLVFLALGLYLTIKGYHSLDGDQAHRLPILLHRLDPALYADDPFVRCFDEFNPHRGSLQLLGTLTRAVGLPATLAGLFAITFALSVRGVHRLASAFWGDRSGAIGWTAVVLFLAAKAGNVGTNHLFESMLLDRLMALALAWVAAAEVVEDPDRGWRRSALLLGVAAWIHPSLGLQLALVFSGAWLAWAAFGGASRRLAAVAIAATGLAIVPGLLVNLAPFGNLREGLPPETFRLLTVELQSPQHMLPHLWRQPQWLAAGAYLLLAAVALAGPRSESTASPRRRLLLMLGVVLIWLAASWGAVEVVGHVGATVFQPFRIATFGRGLCLAIASGHVVGLWRRGGVTDRARAVLIPVACTGDWTFAAVAAIEVVMTAMESARVRIGVRDAAFVGMLAWAAVFLSRHDTERGHRALLGAAGAGVAVGLLMRRRPSLIIRKGRLYRAAMVLAWAGPTAGLVAGWFPTSHPKAGAVVARWRFAATPVEDDERLGAWCREHTPAAARFIGPPGPKGFRLWSRRSWAFNRAGSPYHARGLGDWYERFRDHVAFDGPPEELVRAYLEGRHRLEGRYDAMTDAQLAALAARQGAEFVVAGADREDEAGGPLERLHAEGEFAVYRVRPERVAQVQR
ncbi:MAG: hypothetical protein BGO49_03140 [Planctomycetales bacterium 71-10]|nr:MAG: hypothetical protein BGO49_03140 [Planctomycetales bacterium 71-10]